MPTTRHVQTSLAAGEFDPLLWSREDVTYFYNSARLIENAVPLPQGGVKRREGWRMRAIQRGQLANVSTAGATVSAPNGGAGANLIDGNTATGMVTTTGIGTSTTYVVASIDFGAAVTFSLMDLYRPRIIGAPQALLVLQRSTNGTTWVDASQMTIGNIEYDNRRFAGGPGTGMGAARYWRITVRNTGNLGSATIGLGEATPRIESSWADGGTIGEFALHRITSSVENEFIVWFSDENADIFSADDGAWVASVAIPHDGTECPEIKVAGNLDTLILYHRAHAPYLIQRLGSNDNWRGGPVEFSAIASYPFSDSTSGGRNEIQRVTFEGMSTGDEFFLEMAGETSDVLTYPSSNVAAVLQAGIDSLPGVTGNVTISAPTSSSWDIEYTGASARKSWPTLIVDITSGSGAATISRIKRGRPNQEPLWSATRGYPACGTFYQGRHWMGGFAARPDLIIASRAGALFDFKTDVDPVSTSPIIVAPALDDQVTVQSMYPGRHMQIFTSSAELFIPDEPITPENIAIKATSRHGTQALTQPLDVQGGTLFIDRNGRALREYLFTDTEQSYSAEPVSLLAGHLVSSPRAMAVRRGRDVDEPTLLLIANTGVDRNGAQVPASFCVIDRAQQVTGFFRVDTVKGRPLSFAAAQGGNAFTVVRRELAGQPWNYLEQFDDDCMSDCSILFTGAGTTLDVSSHPWLIGQEVFIHVDGLPVGLRTVPPSGVIDLDGRSYAERAEVGLRMIPRIVLHPFKGKGQISPTMQNQRIFRALFQLERTADLATAMDGQRARPLALRNHDSGLWDPTIDEMLFTGPVRVSGLGKWQKEPCLFITQIDPLPFLVRSISYDVRY
jgi:hypothetical protein